MDGAGDGLLRRLATAGVGDSLLRRTGDGALRAGLALLRGVGGACVLVEPDDNWRVRLACASFTKLPTLKLPDVFNPLVCTLCFPELFNPALWKEICLFVMLGEVTHDPGWELLFFTARLSFFCADGPGDELRMLGEAGRGVFPECLALFC